MSKTNVQSVRMSDETKEKFMHLKENLGLSQDDVLATLIQVYELNQAKEVIPEQAANVDQLQSHLNGIMNQYLNILEINKTAEERISQKFSIRLENNEQTVNNLNERIKKEQETVAKKEKELQEAQEKIQSLKFLEGEIQQCLEAMRDKDTIIKGMEEKIESLEHFQNEYPILREEHSLLNEKYNKVNLDYNSLKVQFESLNRTIEEKNQMILELKNEINALNIRPVKIVGRLPKGRK